MILLPFSEDGGEIHEWCISGHLSLPSSIIVVLVFLLCILLFCFFVASTSVISSGTAEGDVLKALSQIIDPDFGTDIVSCGFVKDLLINEALGEVIYHMDVRISYQSC